MTTTGNYVAALDLWEVCYTCPDEGCVCDLIHTGGD